MEVILVTTLFSVAFAVLFLALFLRDRQLRDFGGMEREALMPLEDGDEPRSVHPPKPQAEACGEAMEKSGPGCPRQS